MFRIIPSFSRYEIDEHGVIRNRASGHVRRPTSKGTVTLKGNDRIIYDRTVNSLMREAGFVQIWIDPEEYHGN